MIRNNINNIRIIPGLEFPGIQEKGKILHVECRGFHFH